MRTRRFVPKTRSRSRPRSMFLEKLESRRLLAADEIESLLWGRSPRVAVELLVTDQQGYPLSQIEKGETFKLQAWIHDLTPGTAGAYAAYTDVVFDAALATAIGGIEHRQTFVEGRSGDITPGLFDEVGGFRDLENGPSLATPTGIAGVPLFEVKMTADAVGQLVFSANPADDLPAHQMVLVSKMRTPSTLMQEGQPVLEFSTIPRDYVPPSGTLVREGDPVVEEDVYYSTLRLEIVEPGGLEQAPQQNQLEPFDTNADSKVTPADLLGVLTELRCQKNSNANGCENARPDYPDINGDGLTARQDVIHFINHDVVRPFAGPDFYVARIGQPLAISTADGVLLNDFKTEGAVVTARLKSGPAGLTLSEDGSFVWTPPESFNESQFEFLYTASDGKRSVNAKAQVVVRDVADEQVIVSLRTVDEKGEPIQEAVPGDTFFLEAYVQDTRTRPEGIFAAYIDVSFDSTLASLATPITFGPKFPNARRGSEDAGLLDEVGGMQKLNERLVGEVLLFSVPVKAESEGQLTFSPDAADTFPEHYMLLLGLDHPIPAEVIRFNSISLDIIDKNRSPIAQSDLYVGEPDSPIVIPADRGLLANDRDPDQDYLTVRLIDGPHHAALVLEPDGAFAYTPDVGFTGTDSFTYVANDGEFDSEPTTVTLNVRRAGQAVVAFRLEVLNDAGEPVDQVTVGDEFELRVTTEDLRERPQGVFAAYLDVTFNATLVSTLGEATFGETYSAGRKATNVPGQIDEAGAFSSSVRPVGGGEFVLFSQRFTATSAGHVLFASNPADVLPAHEVLVYGLNDAVNPGDIEFGSAELTNVSSAEIQFSSFSLRVIAEGEQPLGVADAMAVDFQVVAFPLPVLANDSTAVSEITAVAEAIGTVNIASDGKSLIYSAPTDFAGHDRFTYTVTDSTGTTEVVDVDVHVKSPFQNFEEPTDTDADGHVAPIDALYGVNELNRRGTRRLTEADAIGKGLSHFLDVNGDLFLAPLDVLIIINELNARAAASAEGESANVLFDDANDEAERSAEPSTEIANLDIVPTMHEVQVPLALERESSAGERYFARLASEVQPLLDDDLIAALCE